MKYFHTMQYYSKQIKCCLIEYFPLIQYFLNCSMEHYFLYTFCQKKIFKTTDFSSNVFLLYFSSEICQQYTLPKTTHEVYEMYFYTTIPREPQSYCHMSSGQ